MISEINYIHFINRDWNNWIEISIVFIFFRPVIDSFGSQMPNMADRLIGETVCGAASGWLAGQ